MSILSLIIFLGEDFFSYESLPKYNTALSPFISERIGTGHFQINNMEIITSHYTKKFFKMWEVFSPKQGLKNIIKSLLYKNSKFICGFWESHLPYSILKSTIQIVWEKEKDILEKISASCYRSASDVYIWLFSHWQIVSIQYSIGNPKLGGLFN